MSEQGEQCLVCGRVYKAPLDLHHTTEECDAVRNESSMEQIAEMTARLKREYEQKEDK